MKATFDAAGDVVVITGGANGIGRALALGVSAAGGKAVICDTDEKALADVVAENAAIDIRTLDVSDRQAVFSVFKDIEREFGKIDSLVCGAAIQPRKAVHEMGPEEWQRVISVNLNGVVWCYQAAIGG